ncbi:hypothetical protein [Pedobacter sp. UBA4863]|uniref:hypothetical protein n=1 Tax=Pedobacter sp. UBA4863 TaxID=1947060 RepID=UPI0025EA9F31|nr:hypothetical protein [Pedobacter sp. UBA4863]
MKNYKLSVLFLAAVLAFSSCRKSDEEEVNVTPKTPETINGEVTANKTLTADRVWYLDGVVLVKNNATLTIEPGTVIRAKVGTKAALVIDKGSKLIADGTVTKPIVFTSGKDAGSRAPGDWGGIILVGKAPTNRITPVQVEGGVALTYGTDNIPADNSGILRYVRIEYAGIGVNDSEINALTFYAVGSRTVVENVQTVYANDDAFEFFGGTVNCKNLIAYATADDDFDFDFGYNGSVQFALSLRDPKFVDAADDGNGIECDNDKDGTDAAPITQPKLSNFTLIGPNNATGTASRHAYGNRWRRGTKFIFNNSIILGAQKGGLNIESDKSANFYKNGDSQFKNNIVAAYTNPFLVTATTLTVAEIQTKATTDGNLVLTDANVGLKLNAPFSLTAPNFLPATGSPALAGTWVATTGATSVTYRGAFGTTDWTAGWANWNSQNTNY